MKPPIEFRPARNSFIAKVIENGEVAGLSPADADVAIGKPGLVSKRGPASNTIGAKPRREYPIRNSAGRVPRPISADDIAKMASVATSKTQEPAEAEKPQSRTRDLKALQTRLKPLLSKSEFKQMTALFARLEKHRKANNKAQAAWRDRQRTK